MQMTMCGSCGSVPEMVGYSFSYTRMAENEQVPIFVINLDADESRLAAMREQLDALALAWERISAVDGTALSPAMLLQENRRARPRRLSAGEIGCLQSHVAVWQRIADGSESAALVLEDDVLLAPDITSILKMPSLPM